MLRHASQNGFADAVVGVVVQDDEVADVFVLRGRRAVEFAGDAASIVAMVRKQQDQALDGHLDEVDGRGLERLEKSAGQAHAHHVAVPE